MLKSPKFGFYKNPLFYTFISNSLALFKTYKIPALKSLTTDYDEMGKSFQKEVRSMKTQSLKELDKRRDDAIRGMTALVKSYRFHFDPAKNQAGNLLEQSIYKYARSIAKLSYQEETAVLTNLLTDWNQDTALGQAIKVLDLADWKTELETANQEFNHVYLARNKEKAHQESIASVSEIREEVEANYQMLTQHLHAHAILNPSENLTALIAELNMLIEKYNTEVSRTKRKETEE